MSSKYQVGDERFAHFVTFTVVNWIDVFTRNEYRNIIIESLNYCIKHKGLHVHAFCIMTNHVHLIVSASVGSKIAFIVRDLKKHTANTLLKAISKNDRESKREWMLWMFDRVGSKNASNDKYQFWQNGYHPVELCNVEIVDQRLNYIHENPVRAGFVLSPEDFMYSSARNYSSKRDCVMDVTFL